MQWPKGSTFGGIAGPAPIIGVRKKGRKRPINDREGK